MPTDDRPPATTGPIAAARRPSPRSPAPTPDAATTVFDVERPRACYYGAFRAVRDVDLDDRAATRSPRSSARRAAASRTVLRCLNRMNDLIPGARVEGKVALPRRRPLRPARSTRSRCAAASAWCSRSRTRSRSRSTTTSPTARRSTAMQGQPRRHRRAGAARRRAVGRGQGPAQERRPGPVRRPAAAAVHRPRHRGRARGDPDGRAVLGARPDRHRPHRGPDARAQGPATRS